MPGGPWLETSSPEQSQGAPNQCARKLRLGPRKGEGKPHPGRVRLSSSWLPELLRQGRHKTQAQQSLCFCGVPENWNLSGLGLGSAHNSGPAPYRAAWSLSSVDGESSHARVGANPVWPEQCECSPHKPVTFVCSALPSPQHD